MAEKLHYTKLKNFEAPNLVKYDSTENVEQYSGIIGQERAKKALNFGLTMKARGYNIYVAGQPGCGKTTFAKNFAKENAKTEAVPPDICYVYNFKSPKHPKMLKITAGLGVTLEKDMEDLIDELLIKLPKVYSNKDFEDSKNNILKELQEKREIIIKNVTEEAKLQNFGVKTTNTGIYFMPIVNGEMITEEQYNELDEKEKEEIMQNTDIIQDGIGLVMSKIKEYEKNTRKEVKNLEYGVGLFTVGYYISKLLYKYKDNEDIIEYLINVKEDILFNIDDFIEGEEEEEEEEEAIQAILPWASKKVTQEAFFKYKVNILVNNKDLTGAPVIIDHNPTYANLVGEIEYDNEYGNFITDFLKIRPGLLHKANGGYLILNAQDVFSNIYSWESLRRVLRTNEIVIEPLREYTTGIAMNSIKPEPMQDINVKVILIGSHIYYDLIYDYDEEFRKMFKIRVDFDYEMNYNKKNVEHVLGFIKNYVNTKGYMDFTRNAIIKVLEYFSRLSERQDKLSTNFNRITEILEESTTWAKIDNAQIINKGYIEKAINEREYRLGMYEEKLSDMIDEDIIMIDTKGKKVGQINALAVLDMGDYAFAKPSRITATTYVGKAGVVNIEKEAKMSGNIHDKGVQVLIGYLGGTYAKNFPLSVSCRICFEQNYNGIDGDSASSTELYAILSSISEIPINQEFAVTGSMNQHGEIQPIGGVTYKIECFFDICKKRGLTGNQGVIIPIQNVVDIVLKDEVIEAVKNGMFSIYPISHVDEGIELLTGTPVNILHEKVLERLKKYNQVSAKQ